MILKSIKQKDLKVFFLYAISVVIFLMLTLFFRDFLSDKTTSLLFRRLFPIAEFALLSIYYYINYSYKKKLYLFIVSNFIFTIVSLTDLFINPGKKSFYLPLAFECLFFVLIILYYFYEMMKFIESIPIYKLPSFWISIAFLIYFSGTFFLYLSYYSVLNDPEFRKQYQIIYGSVTIIKNILLCIGVFVYKSISTFENNSAIHPNVDLENFNPLLNNTNL